MRRQSTIPWDEDSYNPHFRPKLVAIADKVRRMPTVRKDAKARGYVIQKLLWDIRQNGATLSFVISEAMHLWRNHSDHQKMEVQPAPDLILTRTEHGGPALEIPGIPGYFAWTGTDVSHSPPTDEELESHLAVAPPGFDEEPGPDEPSTAIALDDKELKKKIRTLIFEHHYVNDKSICACGRRDLLFAEEWAKHLRVQIWNGLEEVVNGSRAETGQSTDTV